MDIFETVEETFKFVEELKDITSYIDKKSKMDNLSQHLLTETFYPLRLQDIADSFNFVKVKIESKYKLGIPKELSTTRDLFKDLAIETSELYDMIDKEYDIEVIKINSRIMFILNNL